VLLGAYFAPFLLLRDAHASAVSCAASGWTCITENGNPNTRFYAGQVTDGENKRGVRGAMAATATTLTNPSSNGFADWYGIVDQTPPMPVGKNWEWMQAGWANGAYNGNGGYFANSDFNWYSELYSWCNQNPQGHALWYGAGGYTPNTVHKIEVYQLEGSYDCGSGGSVFVYLVRTFFNGQLAATGWLSTFGSAYRADANVEYLPYDWLNPVGRVCFGNGSPATSCNSNSFTVDRLVSATWSTWGSSQTVLTGTGGYQRNNQQTNFRFNVTSAY